MVSSDAVCGGGVIGGRVKVVGAGSWAVPPSLNTKRRDSFSSAKPYMLLSPPIIAHEPPVPAMMATYCSPSTA